MLSFMYTFIKNTIGYKQPVEDETDEIDNVVARLENAYESEKHKDEYFDETSTYYKTGNVTFIATDYIVVDDIYVCDAANVSINNLKVGDKIHYSAVLDTNKQQLKIKTVISVVDESWDDEISNCPINITKPQTITKYIVGKVTDRKNRILIIEPNNITIDLNKVQSEFIPVIGDWLKLESKVKIDEDIYNLDGEILEITKIQPLRSKLNIATVSSFDPSKEVGVIGKDTVFNKRICDSGYVPRTGDKVISDSIESDQGIYKWRSLTVVPIHQVPKEKTKLSILYNNLITAEQLNELIKNKCGIVISDDLNLILNIQEEKNVTVTVQNVGDIARELRKGCFMIKKANSQLRLVQPTTLDTTSLLNPSDKLTYMFKCTGKFLGISEELLVFHFNGFEIGRIFNITVKPKTIQNKWYHRNDSAKITKHYVPELNEQDQDTYIPGVRPCKPPLFIKARNGVFKVPKYYWEIISKCMKEGKSQTEYEYDVGNAIPSLLNRLSFESYKDRFHALLYLEEIAQMINMQQYNIESTIMKHCGEYLVMEVPGLAEKRPSLLVGDRAIVSFKWDISQGKLKYEGFIHKVTNMDIFLKFNQKFHEQYNNEDCQVTFKCSQSALKRCHNAVNMAINRLGENLLFPTRVVEKECQLDLVEDETEEVKEAFEQRTHRRTDSVSSESSSASITSISNKSNSTTKSSTKVSVVQRLFNVKPIRHNTKIPVKSDTNANKPEQCIETKNEITLMDVNKKPMNVSSQHTDIHAELKPFVSQVNKRKLVWFHKNLNHYQKEAVRNILKGYARPLPYVIFGPPGTGKTITLCETILQILSIIPESRLLIATPSNSSANLVAERLLDSGVLKPGDMVRLVAYHCLSNDSIPSKLLPYCATAELADEATIAKRKYSGVGPRLSCTMSVLGRHRITIGTCIALGVLNNIGFPRGHFTHVLIDEAGQATEPEILIPLNFIHSDYGQVILAGDPLQLGPVVQSKIAKSFGLDESFLSRLLRHFPYQRDPNGFETQYDPRVVTKLIINYRSLPEILQLSSSLFYDSELKAQVSSKTSKEAKLLQTLASELPERKGSPPAIVFHGVNGENYKDSDSPSWYNPQEATQVYLYLLKLYKCGLSPDDIGIISPYQKQVLQIRELLMELDIELPKVGSVEGFQGQERNIIIISTVRSSNNLVTEDIKYCLGFVACPRRLNVAITRARALVIILGNPRLLARDPYWRSVLIYCIDHNSYTGCSFAFSDIDDPQSETNDS